MFSMGDQTMKGLSLYDDVDTEINFQLTKEAVDFSLCLVGRFLTNKNIRVPIMKEQLANVWRPLEGVTIT